ncbi:MAG: sigma-54-dependent Fis family transcriptional regulator, partial [Myxococcales bacterium]|nr:sigma-54-dependent Fis family transcriptional regulator [Myxococcales bacterium]
DLYYRLNVVTLNPPPLREREGDIALLARRFLATTAARNRRSKLNFAPAALEALSSYEFPGNVRQLQNIIERLGILADSDLISEQDVRRALPIPSSGSSAAKPATEGSADADGSVGAGGPAPSLYEPGKRLHDLLRDAERAIILEAIAANGQNKAAAARALGVERAHFYKKCKALGVSVDSED